MRTALWPDSAATVVAETSTYLEDGCIAGEPHGVFVAESTHDARLVGFIEVSIHTSARGCCAAPVGYVEGWFVAETHRRTGLGRQLCRAGESWCKARNCTALASDTVEPYAALSIPAHQACGFEIVQPASPNPEGVVHFLKTIA